MVITNVSYNVQQEKDKCMVNVYPVVNISGNVLSGLPVIVNININIET